jgi:hypothetical protein
MKQLKYTKSSRACQQLTGKGITAHQFYNLKFCRLKTMIKRMKQNKICVGKTSTHSRRMIIGHLFVSFFQIKNN